MNGIELKDLSGVWDSWRSAWSTGCSGGDPGGGAAGSEGWDGLGGNAWDEILE